MWWCSSRPSCPSWTWLASAWSPATWTTSCGRSSRSTHWKCDASDACCTVVTATPTWLSKYLSQLFVCFLPQTLRYENTQLYWGGAGWQAGWQAAPLPSLALTQEYLFQDINNSVPAAGWHCQDRSYTELIKLSAQWPFLNFDIYFTCHWTEILTLIYNKRNGKIAFQEMHSCILSSRVMSLSTAMLNTF